MQKSLKKMKKNIELNLKKCGKMPLKKLKLKPNKEEKKSKKKKDKNKKMKIKEKIDLYTSNKFILNKCFI